MPVYVYKAMTKNGQIVKNKVEEASKQRLIKRIKENGLIPIQVIQTAYRSRQKTTKKKNITDLKEILKNANTTQIYRTKKIQQTSTIEKINLYFSASERITTRDIIVFTQNFYLLKKANFNNIHALNTIIQSTENLNLKGILEDILAGVENGEYMYTTMEYYSEIFPYLYINMIKVGELSGSLTKSLSQAVEYLEDNEKITKKLKSILIPNIIQCAVILLMLILGTVFAIPQVQALFDEVGTTAKLPAITLAFQAFMQALIAHWYIIVGIIVAIIVGVILYSKTSKGRYNIDYFKYTMPVFGKLIYSLDMSKLMKAMLLNLENGMRIQDALEVSKNVIKNVVLLSIVETAINNMLIGYSWIDPFEKAGLSSSMTTEMLRIGMQTDLSEMLEKLVEYLDIDINNSIDRIMKVLPQIVYTIVGAVLILFVLIILVPVMQVYMGNFLFEAYVK